MRYLIVLAVGLLAGFLAASSLSNALAHRNAWPRALMQVMKHDLGQSRAAANGTQCASSQMSDAAARLRLIGNELTPALLPADTKDRVLAQYIERFQSEVSGWNTQADCTTQAAALTRIDGACDACHRDYR